MLAHVLTVWQAVLPHVHGELLQERAADDHGAGDPADQPGERGAAAQISRRAESARVPLHGPPTPGNSHTLFITPYAHVDTTGKLYPDPSIIGPDLIGFVKEPVRFLEAKGACGPATTRVFFVTNLWQTSFFTGSQRFWLWC